MNKGERVGALILLSLIAIAITVNIIVRSVAVEHIDEQCVANAKSMAEFKKNITPEPPSKDYWKVERVAKRNVHKGVSSTHQRDRNNEDLPIINED
ncbi:MAG: hypothetical protein RR383_05775 [Muribaculaceae bacterium]